MNLSTRAKVALILGVLLILAIVGMVLFNKNRTPIGQTQTSPVASMAISSVIPGQTIVSELPIGSTATTTEDQINYVSPTAVVRTPVQADANGVKRYTVAVTPAPDAGYFDWTKNLENGTYEVADISQSNFIKTQPCEVLGLSNSWSNIVGKLSCDSLNFLATTVTDALNQIDCAFNASAISANYSPNVTYKLEDGQCLILDRTK